MSHLELKHSSGPIEMGFQKPQFDFRKLFTVLNDIQFLTIKFEVYQDKTVSYQGT